MSMDLTFLSDSYTQQILHQLRNVRDQEMRKKGGFRFEDILSSKENTSGTVSAEAKDYAEYLKKTYGNVTIKSVGKDQRSMDDLGMGTAGTGNVVIAPNILEQMAQDPEKAAYYEEKIKRYFQELQIYMKHKMMTDQIRLDLTGERGVLTDRGTDWISALAYMGGHIL